MSNTTFNLLSIVGTNLLLYVLFIITPYLSTADTYMGVFLDHAYRKTPETKRILKYFLLYTTLVFAGFSLILIFLSLRATKINDNPLLAIAFLGEVLLYFVVYGHAYTQTKAYKKSLNLPEPKGSKVLIDTAFIEEKTKLKMIYKKLLYIPMLIGLFLGIYTLYHYKEIPELIPTHFNAIGEIDGWSTKNLVTALLPSGLCMLLALIFSYTLDSTFNKRSHLSKSQLEKGKAITLKYLKWSAIAIVILAFSITLMMMGTIFAMVEVTPLNPIYNSVSLAMIIIGIALMSYNNFRYKRDFEPFKEKDACSPIEEKDDYWLWGMIYNNPNDPALMVSRRHGIGWTVNIGSFKGKLIMFALLAFIICAIIFTAR